MPSVSVQMKIFIFTELIISDYLSANDQDLIKFILKNYKQAIFMLGALKVKLHRAESKMPNDLEKEFKQKNGKEISCCSFFWAFSTKII